MKKMTPLEKLQADKNVLKSNIHELELQLEESWTSIKRNAGGLFIDGIKYLIFPSKRGINQTEDTSNGFFSSFFNNILSYYSTAKELFPIVWPFLHPLYLKWRNKNKNNCQEE